MIKQVLSFEGVSDNFVELDFNGQTIIIKKRLGLDEIARLVDIYVTEYTAENERNSQVLFAEYGFKSALFDIAVTNFQIGGDDIPTAVSSGIFESVISKIENVEEILRLVEKTIDMIEKRNSFDAMAQKVGNQLVETLKDISKMGVDEKLIATMVDAVKEVKALKINQ